MNTVYIDGVELAEVEEQVKKISREDTETAIHPALKVNPEAVEWYTPVNIIKAAHRAMDGITLDVASCAQANETVKAICYYCEEDDGLRQPWWGNVWMNHPYGRTRNKLWVSEVVHRYEIGEIAQACVLTYASTDTRWFRPLLEYPICFLYGRTHFVQPNGESGPCQKATAVTYLGRHVSRFEQAFRPLGHTKV